MRASQHLLVAFGFFCPLVVGGEPEDDFVTLREAVVKASSSKLKAKAYQSLFKATGQKGLADLTKDDDTGIALQAAWELHKKAAMRPKHIALRTDDVYDHVELEKFVTFLKQKTKAPVPNWWAETILDVDVFPGRHHAFSSTSKTPVPKLRKSKAGVEVPDGAEVTEDGDALAYTSGGRSVKFLKTAFDANIDDAMAGLLTEKRSVIASYTTACGARFQLAGFEGNGGKGGKPTWTADVWSSGRTELGGRSFHLMELTQKDDSVYVFGAESHGMYMEAFDIATGKCRFRFCTAYWFDFSEAWGLK